MTALLVDTSVLVKWFHTSGETEVAEARAIRAAHVRGELDAYVIDLGFYEIGNVLLRALRWAPDDVALQLEDLRVILGPALTLTDAGFRTAALLAGRHRLSFYDAAWAASAQELEVALVSADRLLLGAGLAESATAVASRLGLLVE